MKIDIRCSYVGLGNITGFMSLTLRENKQSMFEFGFIDIKGNVEIPLV